MNQSSASAGDAVLRSGADQHSQSPSVHHSTTYAPQRWDSGNSVPSLDDVTRSVNAPGFTLPPIVTSSNPSVQPHTQPRSQSGEWHGNSSDSSPNYATDWSASTTYPPQASYRSQPHQYAASPHQAYATTPASESAPSPYATPHYQQHAPHNTGNHHSVTHEISSYAMTNAAHHPHGNGSHHVRSYSNPTPTSVTSYSPISASSPYAPGGHQSPAFLASTPAGAGASAVGNGTGAYDTSRTLPPLAALTAGSTNGSTRSTSPESVHGHSHRGSTGSLLSSAIGRDRSSAEPMGTTSSSGSSVASSYFINTGGLGMGGLGGNSPFGDLAGIVVPANGVNHLLGGSISGSLASPVSSTNSSSVTNGTVTASAAASVNGNLPGIKPKRRRADATQLRTLNATYERTAFPSTEERAELARKLGMSPRQVQIWFQNKRQSFRQTRTQQQAQAAHPSHPHHTSHHASHHIHSGTAAGPGTFGSIQLTSPIGSTSTTSTSSSGTANGGGSYGVYGGGYGAATTDTASNGAGTLRW